MYRHHYFCLPIDPLRDQIERRHLGLRQLLTENERRSYYRARRKGFIAPNHADKLANILLGAHPAEIWGEAWWDIP